MSKKDAPLISSSMDQPVIHPQGSPAVQGIAPTDVQVVDFNSAAPLRYGDCKLSGFLNGTLNNGPTFRLRSDGIAELLATFYSNDDDDVWVFDEFQLRDNRGTVIFSFPHFSSPPTTTDRQEISWTAELRYPANIFSSVAQVSFKYRC